MRCASPCRARRVYLRKYQASSAMMISSRDRTSTVGRMWWLGDVTSSEEGEAEPGVRERSQHRSRKRGARPVVYAVCMSCKRLAAFMRFSRGNIASFDKIKTWHSNTTTIFSSGHRHDLITELGSILSTEISIRSFHPVVHV